MIKELSVLIPCHNSKCRELVESLSVLLEREKGRVGLHYEVLVADDGSTDNEIIEYNKHIDSLCNCRYIIRGKNVGRAAIRNFLAQEAKYEWLIFIDCDMVIDNDRFIHNYIHAEGNVIVGGLKIGGDPDLLKNNIRYMYEKSCESAHSARQRKLKPHREFRTTNFLIKRHIMLTYPFDENFKNYGYEDVLMGKSLHNNNIEITHIENNVLIDEYEDNNTFINKTEEALRTLHQFKRQLQEYSTLLKHIRKIRQYHLMPIVKISGKLFKTIIRNNLTSNKPKLFLFNIYKLLYYTSL